MARHLSTACFLAVITNAAISLGEDVTVGFHQLRIPDGYEIELVAGPNLVERPIAVARDEQGALYVTDSAGMSDRADQQLELKPHRIRKLIDENQDGSYDTSTLFAEGLMFPEGCLWYEGSLYVAAPPEIWKLTDTDGDGRCDQREVWFDGKTLTGCGNDLHGPYLGPDGWFYWCKGAFAEQSYQINGRPFTTRSSHVFRSLPDGSRMEPVLTGGMDNPVNVAFLPTGDRFLSCTFFLNPANGQRDGLIHSIYGGVYGKQHDSIDEHQQTGAVMPVLVHMGAAAPCGLIGSNRHTFHEPFKQDRLFACYFNLHKVVEHTLIPDGSTYTTQERDLVACDHPDFHPTDVFEDADGSLLIVDTGGWYKICCPTSQLAKPDVLGGIYRLRRRGQPAIGDPLGLELNWQGVDNLIYHLLDPSQQRPWVQQRALRELRKHGAEAVAALLKLHDFEEHTGRDEARRQTIWILAGMDIPAARAAVRELYAVESVENQRVCLEVMALWRDADAGSTALGALNSPSPFVRRAAAETLGRLNESLAAGPLLERFTNLEPLHDMDPLGGPANAAERIAEHALIYALIELENREVTRSGLQATSPRAQRAALVALDQMRHSDLTVQDVLPKLKDADVSVARTAAWIVGRHAEWGPELVDYYRSELAQMQSEQQQLLAEQLGRLAKSTAIQELLRSTLTAGAVEQRQVTLRAMTLSGLPEFPASWLHETAQALPGMTPEIQAAAIAEIRQWPRSKEPHMDLNAALLAIARTPNVEAGARLDALSIASPLPALDAELFAWLADAASSNPERGLSTAAAKVLGMAKLTAEQQTQLLRVVSSAAPFELAALLPAFQTGEEELGLAFLVAVQASPGFRGLRVDQLQAVLAKYPPTVQAAGKPLLKALNASVEEQTAHLEQLLAALQPGDVRRGHEIFHSQKAKCITCHTRAYNGGRLGPDLTNIGKVRNTRDLLEAIVYPSASLVRGYESVTVALNDGRVLAGIKHSEDRQQIVLALDAEKRQPIARTEIEELHPSAVSLMPQGMDKVLTVQDLSDLIAFLQQ